MTDDRTQPIPPQTDTDLPPGWAWTTIGEVYDILGGGTPSTQNPDYWDGDIPWITSADIHGLRDIRPRKTVSRKGVDESATNLVPGGTLIVVTRVALGKVALTETPICFSQNSQGLVGGDKVLYPIYSLYYLSQAVQSFRVKSRGTTISGVTKKQLRDLPIPLAPLPEQRRIVEAIETQFTRLDAAVAEQQRIVEEVERRLSVVAQHERVIAASLRRAARLRQAILKRAFSGRLV